MDNQFDFVPPPIPKKNLLTKKHIYITLGLVVIITITVGIIIALNGKSTSEESVDDADNNGRRYIQSEDQLRDGEIAMYDSDGRMYAAEIDEDYYSGNATIINNGSDSTVAANSSMYSSEHKSENTNSKSGNGINRGDSDNDEEYDTYKSSSSHASSNTSSYTKSGIASGVVKEKLEIGGFISLRKSTWLVLDIDKDRALIVWCSCKSDMKYNDSRENVTWETSSLRKYLNEDFYNTFTISEKKRILTTDVVNGDNPDWGTDGGNNTQDNIFILSADEIIRYKDIFYKDLLANPGDKRLFWDYGHIWVRTPGKNNNQATTCSFGLCYEGGIYMDYDGYYVNTNSSNIRDYSSGSLASAVPAMWIKVD